MSGFITNLGPRTIIASLLLWFISMGSGMAKAVVAIDTVSTVFDREPNTLTTSHIISGTNHLMIVGVSVVNANLETVTSVTYNGVGLNFLGQVAQSNDSRVELWSYLSPPVTTANVIVNFDDRVEDGAGFGVITFTGVDQSSPLGSFQSQSGESRTASINVISATGKLVLGVMAAERQGSNPAAINGAQQWSYKVRSGNNRTAGAGAAGVGAASTALTWSLNETDDWAVGTISIRPSTGEPIAQYRFDELSWDGSEDELIDSSPSVFHGQSNGGTLSQDAQICTGQHLTVSTTISVYRHY